MCVATKIFKIICGSYYISIEQQCAGFWELSGKDTYLLFFFPFIIIFFTLQYCIGFWTLLGGMIWENGIETCIISCKIHICF